MPTYINNPNEIEHINIETNYSFLIISVVVVIIIIAGSIYLLLSYYESVKVQEAKNTEVIVPAVDNNYLQPVVR